MDYDSTQVYLRTIKKFRPLTKSHEKALITRAQQGDLRARDELVGCCLRFVVSVALKYRKQGVALEDLIASGNVGLLEALSKYDLSRGARLMTFARNYIRSHIIALIASQSRICAIPENNIPFFQSLYAQGEQSVGDWKHRNGPDLYRYAYRHPVDPETAVYMDRGIQDVETLPRLERLLTPRECFIIRRFYWDGISLQEVGAELGITRSRVYQVKRVAEEKLRKWVVGHSTEI